MPEREPRDKRDKTYPLQAVRELRGHERDAAQAELVAARQRVDDAGRALDELSAALKALGEARAPEVNPAVGNTRPMVSGAELARSGAFARKQSDERLQLTAAVKRACKVRQAASQELRKAELSLQTAHVDREVLERHHQRFASEREQERARKQDDEADDQAAARRKPT